MTRVRARVVFRDARVTVTALESVEITRRASPLGDQMIGQARPLAIVVREAHRTFAIDMAANRLTLEQLREHVPDVDTLIPA